ncbi:hypothetical protein K458DRAFT_296968 [Lentithecium fluviatile CBS 122367]|uniref:YMC020W-like alpha/beta hydrolase domain-containing protein n=1 Tax=Lentithecium fluviatile CBS 122367 TaxID=1168545 RepID=A0A6G1J834_9PLEO|nr:hypothetical protein K458DRAFT_296968 [Lentithecium fluviatile CBS 122367]
MSPRKKSKPNPKAIADNSPSPEVPAEASPPTPSPNAPDDSDAPQNAPSGLSVAEAASTPGLPPVSTPPVERKLQKKASRKWLGGGGSWRSKASATVKTAKESIGVSVSGGAASELPDKKSKDPSPAKFLTKRKSSKGDAIPAAMTKLNVSSDGAVDKIEEAKPEETPQEPPTPHVDEPPLPPEPPKNNEADDAAGTWGWRSWWSRPDGYSEQSKAKDNVQSTEDAQKTPLPGATPSEEPDAASKELGAGGAVGQVLDNQDTEMKDVPPEVPQNQDTAMKYAPQVNEPAPRNTSSGSWFWSWSRTQNAQPNPLPGPPPTSDEATPNPDPPTEATPDAQPPQQPEIAVQPPSEAAAGEPNPKDTLKSSGWAFWYREKPKTDNKADEGPHKHVGEVAVSNTPSQSHPEPAQFNEQDRPQSEAPREQQQPVAEEPVSKRSFRSLRGRPKIKSTPKDTPTDTPSSSKPVTPSKTSPVPSPTRPETAPAAQPAPKTAARAKIEPPNIILPEFHHTYRMVQQPSFWQQIRHYFLGEESAQPHLHINPAPPRVKKAVAIGVHGYFPAPIFQKVIGQPKGTSIRFANAAAAAINDWCESKGFIAEVEQIALEGEGFIAERVKTLWKLLLNWIEHIKTADFILVACHSQGVPVAIMLVAKLIQFGCVSATRIGICAMAGVNMGPFIEYKTKYFGPTAAELFEFSNPKSLVSQMYLASLDEVLRFGVRITYVGSIDDQLVSLESSTFSTLSHPYIYRAVFVDGRIHAPDFLTHLVGFTLKLRNLGLPDHGLVRELSPALAGSLYGGEGHSRVYEDPRVYHLAIQHALETTSLPIAPTQARPSTAASFASINIPVPGAKIDERDVYKLRVKEYHEGSAGAGNQNPFFLPWAMRGLLEEEFVKRELQREVEELLGMFEEWKPTGKQLKDVKFRLEAVRSKL